MSGTMMMDRAAMMTGMMGAGAGTMPGGMHGGMNMMMVPRCTMKFEKCQGGMKISCVCEDAMACSMVQNLCTIDRKSVV